MKTGSVMAYRNNASQREGSLLSAANYDNDTFSIHTDQGIDSEDDIPGGARTSGEIREHDRSILLEEEEREEMLRQERERGKGNALKPFKNLLGKALPALPISTDAGKEDGRDSREIGSGRRERRRQRRLRRKAKKDRLMTDAAHGEDGELMYEMEEGGMKDGSSGDGSDSEDSSERDRQGVNSLAEQRSSRRQNIRRICFINIFIISGFALLVFGAWKLSIRKKSEYIMPGQKYFNNGTALFAPTTILVSLDGFRADFLRRGITPRLNALVAEGVSPLYMTPSFPSVTFPNHYTLVTGMYPESHGVVGNTFWDPVMKAEFYYTDPTRSMQEKWWGGEPIWVTAEKQGIRTAIHMWPGSEAHIMEVEPSFLDKYNGKEVLSKKVDRVLELLDKPGMETPATEVNDMRPQFIAAYVPNVDVDGHRFGPNSTEIRTTINNVDKMIGLLFEGLEQRNLTSVVNVIVVSDHGMATTDTTRLLQLEDLIDRSRIDHTDGWPLYGLRPKNPADLQPMYDDLAKKSATNPNFDVYLRDINMPERFHFSKNDRIAPLWIVPKTGWAIVTKEEFDVEQAKATKAIYHPRGLHGYDHEHPLMRAIFVARGPAFPHAPNSRVDVFQNIEVYNIVCDSLGLNPNPNNGTLRLPLKAVGIHTPENAVDVPPDPVTPPTATAATKPEPDTLITISPVEVSSAAHPSVVPPQMVGVDPPAPSANRPVVVDEGTKKEKGKVKEGYEELWDSILGKLKGFKGWLGDLFAGSKTDH